MAKDAESSGAEMVARLAAGDVRALSRAISLVEQGGHDGLLTAARALGRRSRRIGLTGSPGAGKSTLADAMVRVLREQERRVAVLAIDPSSPFTGGALLGDRIRMQGFAGDPQVYLRSMATRGANGGVARALAGVIELLEAAGFDTVLVETVGVGQGEVAVSPLVDVTVLVLVPGMGDDVQSLKAGVMETADVFVVNKADLPGAEGVEAGIRQMQSLGGGDGRATPPVVRTVASTGDGVGELLGAIAAVGVRPARGKAGTGGSSQAAGRVGLDHLGIAVHSLAAALPFYRSLGLEECEVETVDREQVRVAMLPLPGGRIELLEAMRDDSTVGRFLLKHGEGLHHVALRVDRLDERFAAMQAEGVRLASDAVHVGAGGHRYFFVHPSATGGVLLEMVGE